MTYAALNPTVNKTNLHHGKETLLSLKKKKKKKGGGGGMILGLSKLINIPVFLRSSEFTAIKCQQNTQTKKKKRKKQWKEYYDQIKLYCFMKYDLLNHLKTNNYSFC